MENLQNAHPLWWAFRITGQIVVLGMGVQGCAAGTQDGTQFFPPDQCDLPVIDTNGTGDGLAVVFLASYVLDGYDLHDAVRRGQIAARYICSLQGTTSHLITAQQLNSFFSRTI